MRSYLGQNFFFFCLWLSSCSHTICWKGSFSSIKLLLHIRKKKKNSVIFLSEYSYHIGGNLIYPFPKELSWVFEFLTILTFIHLTVALFSLITVLHFPPWTPVPRILRNNHDDLAHNVLAKLRLAILRYAAYYSTDFFSSFVIIHDTFLACWIEKEKYLRGNLRLVHWDKMDLSRYVCYHCSKQDQGGTNISAS